MKRQKDNFTAKSTEIAEKKTEFMIIVKATTVIRHSREIGKVLHFVCEFRESILKIGWIIPFP
jgi:hypothetical protein